MGDTGSQTAYENSHFERTALDFASFADRWDRVAEAAVILLVEDDWLLRQALQEELTASGWAVREAESGETALEILESGATVDLVITDIRLGGAVSGWDVADAFRGVKSDLPVIYVSGNPVLNERRVANSAFLPKPCDTAKLIETCRELLRHRDSRH